MRASIVSSPCELPNENLLNFSCSSCFVTSQLLEQARCRSQFDARWERRHVWRPGDIHPCGPLVWSLRINGVSIGMSKPLVASAIARSKVSDGILEITIADSSGKTQTVRVGADAAHALAQVFRDFAAASQETAAPPTKLPSTFAVGTGRYEPLVLLRFENDVPYGLKISDAAELGRALLDQCSSASMMRLPRLQ